ncbi:helicase protein [Cooperia oncophora]
MKMSEEAHDRLEGRADTFGGLEIRKKKSDDEKKPHVEGRSVLGLDRLARAKKDEHLRKRSDGGETPDVGVTDSVRRGIQKYQAEKYRDERRGLVADSRKRDRDRDRDRKDRDDDRRSRDRREDRKRSDRSDRRDEKRKRKEYETPDFKYSCLLLIGRHFTPSAYGAGTDDDGPVKKSSWDTPSPRTVSSSRRGDSERSVGSIWRSERDRREQEQRRKHARGEDTIRSVKEEGFEPKFHDDAEREQWEAEQKIIDREWYDNDGVYDEEYNPFAKVSEEFVEKREKQWQEKTTSARPRLTLKQQSIKREHELWENNRLHRSGVVALTDDLSTLFDDETDENRVNLLVHNIVPPFLDGRIVFTKQSKPVIPVVDTTCDMAVAAARGSKVVRQFRESEERKKAQEKHWELAGSKLGNIMGVKQKPDEMEDPDKDDASDYRESHQFASHMSEKTEAVSDFAMEKTLRVSIHPMASFLGIIGCTQPRRVAAMSVAKRCALMKCACRGLVKKLGMQSVSKTVRSCPTFTIPGRTFPVEIFHARAPVRFFVMLKVSVAKIFQRAPGGMRKCIVATNIAETSLTVDGILFVIDPGFCKMKVYNPRIGMDALQIFPVSQASANQRAGRAGRTGPGQCFRLYTERQFKEELLVSTVPEIQRTNLSNVVLLLKSLGVDDLLKFISNGRSALKTIMLEFQCIRPLDLLSTSTNTGQLTDLGRTMVEFPLDPTLSKMLIMSESMGCSEDTSVLTIVSMLSVPAIFFRPKGREDEADAKKEKFQVPESDHLTFLNVYLQWRQHKYSARWCADNYMPCQSPLKKVREVRAQLKEIMQEQKIKIVSTGSDWDVIRKCICSAYFHNAGRLKGIGEYVNVRTGIPCFLHPTSALFGMGFMPDYVVYHELVMTAKEYMQCVTAVDAVWLAELGPMFYSVKESRTSRSEKRLESVRTAESMEEEMRLAQKEMQRRKEEFERVSKRPDSERIADMELLPTELLQRIGICLPYTDRLNLSLACSRIFTALGVRADFDIVTLLLLRSVFTDVFYHGRRMFAYKSGTVLHARRGENDDSSVALCQCDRHDTHSLLSFAIPHLLKSAKSLELEDELLRDRIRDSHFHELVTRSASAPLTRFCSVARSIQLSDLGGVKPWTLAQLAQFTELQEITDKLARSVARCCPNLEKVLCVWMPTRICFFRPCFDGISILRVTAKWLTHACGEYRHLNVEQAECGQFQLNRYIHSPLFNNPDEWQLTPAAINLGYGKPAVLAEHIKAVCILIYV